MLLKYFCIFLVFAAALPLSPCYGDWKTDANTRIEQIRKRNAQITVVDQNSQPVSNVNVQIEQIKHRFAFGTCIRIAKMGDNNYKNFILNHFEWAVCENETKWRSNEDTRDVVTYTDADTITNWCLDNGIKMRGHCLFWEQNNSQMPTWVPLLPSATYPTPSDMNSEVDERIVSAVNHFKNKFLNWDVDNEMLTDNTFGSYGETGRVHMFQYAKQLDPNGGMFMNEYYGNSFGGYSSSAYVSRATNLINLGAPIDGFGIQAHLLEDTTFLPLSYYNGVLQPLAVFGKPIWATEFDASHTTATTSADNIENFMRICFSHANVEGIIFWGFMQDQMWRPNAYLVGPDGTTLSPGGVRYEALMDEWTTEDANTTDPNGKAGFRGFHGTYEITLSKPGLSAEIYTIELEPGDIAAQFVLEMDTQQAGDNIEIASWISGLKNDDNEANEMGFNRALVFIAHCEESVVINLDSVTYGGQPMTKIIDRIAGTGTRAYVAAYILDEAGITAAGADGNFVPSWSATPDEVSYSSVFLSNVDQIEPNGATASNSTSTSTPNPITTDPLATGDGDMVIDAATCGSLGDYTVNNGFTKGIEQDMASSTGATGVTGYKAATGAFETPSVTFSPTPSRQVIIGFVVQASAPLTCGQIQAAGFGLLSDLNGDCYVNFKDLKVISDYWLNTECGSYNNCDGADFAPTNGTVDFFDLNTFAKQWMQCNDPGDTNCVPNW